MTTIVKDIVKDIVDISINTIQQEDNRKKIETTVLSPLIEFILEKIKPYILITGIFFIILTALVITIMLLVIFTKK